MREVRPSPGLRARDRHAVGPRAGRCRRRVGRGGDSNADLWRALAAPDGAYRFCANAAQKACNWLVEASSPDSFCLSCRHNRTIPDVTLPANLEAWQKIEIAKHRLFYSLLRWRLPMPTRVEDPAEGLAFDFLAELPHLNNAPVMTGHDNGLITIALAEADDAAREQRRVAMHEPYRTLLGHFRHETGHYFWDRLVRDRDQLDACRALFGDDRQDYGAGPADVLQQRRPRRLAVVLRQRLRHRRIPGRTSPRPGRITSISSIRSRSPAPSACRRTPG